MDRQTRKRLHDAIEAVEEILEITEGQTLQAFVEDTVRKKAVYYDLAVLGEALNTLGRESLEVSSSLSGRRAAIDMEID